MFININKKKNKTKKQKNEKKTKQKKTKKINYIYNNK